MTQTYDVSTSVGQVRLMIPDHDENADDFLFTDEDIAGFLSLEGTVKGAAALALETMASNDAYMLKSLKAGSASVDGPATAAGILQRAALLRHQVMYPDSGDGVYFDIAEVVTGPFSARERLFKQGLRGG
jgi:hypothetical protein